MQKMITLVLCITAFSTSLFAGDLRVGAIVGPSFSNNIYLESTEQSEVNGGIVAGVIFGIGDAKKFEFQPEILFFQKGNGISDLDITRNYLDVPLLFKWNFSEIDAVVRGNFYIGPFVGVLLSAKTENDSDLYDLYTPVDAGIAFGGGIGIKAGPGRIVVDFRSTIGTVPLYDRDYNEYTINSSLSIMSGYVFEL